jgi:hypothetical protein
MPLQSAPISTFGEFISVAIRKELLQIWLREDPSSFDVEVVTAVSDAACSRISEDLIQLAKEWAPTLALEVNSPLVDLGHADGETDQAFATELAVLTSSLLNFFESVNFFEPLQVGESLGELAPRLPSWFSDFQLPSHSIFGLAAVIAPVLLRAQRLPRSEDQMDARPEAPPGSQEELLTRQLQQCRKRIFSLERELVVQSRTEKEKVSFEKSERAKSETRLMEINSQLEERLKARTEELRKAGQKLIEAQRGMDHAKFLLEDKNKQIAKFEYKEQQRLKYEEDRSEREKEYGKRLLRLAIQEDAMKQREKYRLEKLQSFIKGDEQVEDLSDSNADVNMRSALEKVEDEFEVTFKQRQEKFDAALREYERKVEEKKAQYNVLNKDLLKAGAHTKKPLMIDMGIQAQEECREISPVAPGAEGDSAAADTGNGGGAEIAVAPQDDAEESQQVPEGGPANEDEVVPAPDLPALGRRASGISEEVEQEAVAAFNMGLQNARDAI